MKVLFDNLVNTATLAALHADGSYPVTNIRHVFLKKAFRSTEATDTITVTFAADKIIDSAYLAFTNATAVTMRLYNVGGTLLSTKTIPVATLGLNFTAISAVRSVQVDLTAAVDVYLGALGIGFAYTMPDPVHDWEPGFQDNSDFQSSDDGQNLINKVAWLGKYPMNFFVQSVAKWLEIRTLLSVMERPVFVDFFENAKSIIPPFYAVIVPSNPSKSYNVIRFSLEITEAR